MSPSFAASPWFKSKTQAAALALLLGWMGAHRLYLHGWRDKGLWAHLAGALLGIWGMALMRASGQTSTAGWVLSAVGAASLLCGFLAAIVYGLRPDDKWDARFNPAGRLHNRSGWTVIFVVIFALFIGASLLMGGLAYSFQHYFEAQSGIHTSLD